MAVGCALAGEAAVCSPGSRLSPPRVDRDAERDAKVETVEAAGGGSAAYG